MLNELTAAEVRREEYHYRTVQLDGGIHDIQTALYEYARNCRPMADLRVDPSNPKKAVWTIEAPGITKSTTILVFDFVENEDGTATTIEVYQNGSSWYRRVDQLLAAINDPATCVHG